MNVYWKIAFGADQTAYLFYDNWSGWPIKVVGQTGGWVSDIKTQDKALSSYYCQWYFFNLKILAVWLSRNLS